jgi:hypothetical protein
MAGRESDNFLIIINITKSGAGVNLPGANAPAALKEVVDVDGGAGFIPARSRNPADFRAGIRPTPNN